MIVNSLGFVVYFDPLQYSKKIWRERRRRQKDTQGFDFTTLEKHHLLGFCGGSGHAAAAALGLRGSGAFSFFIWFSLLFFVFTGQQELHDELDCILIDVESQGEYGKTKPISITFQSEQHSRRKRRCGSVL